jgi:hypothetical protein
MSLQAKVLSYKSVTGSGDYVARELSGVRSDGVVGVSTAISTSGRTQTQVLYETTYPKVTSLSPKDGTASVPTGVELWVCFDEVLGDLGSSPTSYVLVHKNGAVEAITNVLVATVSGSGVSTNRLRILGAAATASKTYQVVIRSTLPFASGRTLGQDFVFTYATA